MKILRSPDGEEGGGDGNHSEAPSLHEQLPDNLKASEGLNKFQNVTALGQGYLDLQSQMGKMGQERIKMPTEDSPAEDWNSFFTKAGRPDSASDYKASVDLPEGLEINQGQLSGAKDKMYNLGLTGKQASGVLDLYYGMIGDSFSGVHTTMTEAQDKLKAELGDTYDAKLQIASNTLKSFSDNEGEFAKFLDESNLGNDARMVKFLIRIGEATAEDQSRRGDSGGTQFEGGPEAAKIEIGKLVMDSDFQAALNNRGEGGTNHPGHKQALAKWLGLHRASGDSYKTTTY